MANTIRRLVLGLTLCGFASLPGGAAACPAPPLIEEVAARAAFIGRVVPISTISVEGDAGTYYVTRARVTERVRGGAGLVEIASWALLPEREMLVFAEECVFCDDPDRYQLSERITLDWAASGELGGAWFDLASASQSTYRPEALRAESVDGPDGPRTVVSWRRLTSMISGADGVVECRREAWALYPPSACASLDGADAQACYLAEMTAVDARLARCQD